MTKIINEITMMNPVGSSKVSSPFGAKRTYETHPGVDIPVPSGTPIKAPLDGVVKTANISHNRMCGGTIDIDYGNGYWSRFCHCRKIDVRPGDVVKRGQVVGQTGGGKGEIGAGNSGGPHLHFTLKKDGRLVNPMDHIDKVSVDAGDFSTSGTTTSSDGGTNWDDFFSKDSLPSAAVKAPKLDPLLKSILTPLEKVLNLKTENIEFFETINESITLEGGNLKTKNVFSVKSGMKMLNPEDGKVLNISDSKDCSKGILIKHTIDDKEYYSKFCNVNPKVTQGERVPKGRIVGDASEKATIQIFDKKQKALNLTGFIKNDSGTLSADPENKNDEKKKIRSMDPLLQAALTPLKLLNLPNLDMKSVSSSEPTKPFKSVDWLKSNSMTKNESFEKQINEIKKLL